MLIAKATAQLGRATLLAGFLAAVFGAFAAAIGARRNDPRTLRLVPRFVALASFMALAAFAVMEWAMITRDFSLLYVQKVGSSATPALYNFAAVWSALEGSILMWVLVLAGYVAAAMWWMRKRLNEPLVGWAMAVLLIVLAYFFLLSYGPANPFVIGPPGVTDGPGPNPLLQNHLLVMFHPPILYLGYVGMTVPFAFAIAALIAGKVEDGWLHLTRRWTVTAWGFLTFGIALGGWWSYEVLGWSGVWAWDPVENASLLPWITGTAYIHSVMVQERRGLLRVWNVSLLIATFSLTILGTFLTRSGVLNSVHAFSESDIGPWLLAMFVVIVAVSLVLVYLRGDQLRASGKVVRGRIGVAIEPVSKEVADSLGLAPEGATGTGAVVRVDPEPVEGGITNTNFVVADAGRRYLVRVGGDIPVHGILRAERARLQAALAALPGVTVFPSEANMVLVRVPDAQRCFDSLKAQGILVKNVSKMHPLLTHCLRLTVGTPSENAQLIRALQATL